MQQDIDSKYQMLKDIISQYSKVIVAYSGGVDSSFLLKVSIDILGTENVLCCIGKSDSLATSEYELAVELAKSLGANLREVFPNEMANPNYLANPNNRCYYCKTELYSTLTKIVQEEHYDVIFSGTNEDDLDDYRPGLKAASEHAIVSPLAAAKLSKQDIRELSAELGLPTASKPAQPCLSSRVAYGLDITPERLKQVDKAEAFLRELGFKELRVRHHDTLARIEVPIDQIQKLAEPELRNKVTAYFKELGFNYISLDLDGFRSGSGNELLQIKK